MSSTQKIVLLGFMGALLLGGLFLVLPQFVSFSENNDVRDKYRVAEDMLDAVEPVSDTVSEEPHGLPVMGAAGVVESFEDCVAAGNSVLESYPPQCRANGMTFVAKVDATAGSSTDTKTIPVTETDGTHVCADTEKRAQICTMEYAPVCGLVEVQCVTTPCDPVPETFSNGCMACGKGGVISYTQGACGTQDAQ